MKVKASAKAAVMAYRFLVAQYESWSMHFACRAAMTGFRPTFVGILFFLLVRLPNSWRSPTELNGGLDGFVGI